jgi:hypothetical protein
MDMQSILDTYRVQTDSSGRGKNRSGWINMQCPYCGRDPYLGYSISGRAFSCWACGRQPLAQTLQLLTNLTAAEVYRLIGELPKEEFTPRVKVRGKLWTPPGLGPLLKPHGNYLRGRGFVPKEITKIWGVQGINFLGGPLAWRLFIPIHLDGEIVSWTTRRLDNKEPRYHAAKREQSIYPIEDCIYGIDFARSSCIIVEGPADCWRIGPGAVSCLGVRIGSAQIKTLSRFPLRVVCFDAGAGEDAAKAQARQLCYDLSSFEGTTIQVTLETGKDPATADMAEIEELRRRYLR